MEKRVVITLNIPKIKLDEVSELLSEIEDLLTDFDDTQVSMNVTDVNNFRPLTPTAPPKPQ